MSEGIPGIPDDCWTYRARQVLLAASKEAGRLRHDFVGTEHLLLGLAQCGGVAGEVLRARRADPRVIGAEIEKLLPAGPKGVSAAGRPLTPRAGEAIRWASQDARGMGHQFVGTEHLLLGLMHETEGVAAKVLVELGIDLAELRAAVLRATGIIEESYSARQLRILVERAVRPVRAGLSRKRKMREELLSHVTAVFSEEMAGADDERAALERTARRFGALGELADRLQESVPAWDRLERMADDFWFRGGESTGRRALRHASFLGAIIAMFYLIGWLVEWGLPWGWRVEAMRFYAFVAAAGFLYVLAVSYFAEGMRQALYEANGSKKSAVGIAFAAGLMAPALGIAGLWLGAMGSMADLGSDLEGPLNALWLGVMTAGLLLPMAQQINLRMRYHGEWAQLDIA